MSVPEEMSTLPSVKWLHDLVAVPQILALIL